MAIGPDSNFRAPRFIIASVVVALAFAAPALAAPVVSDQSIVASLNAPPAGLSCDEAAAQTSVYFHFAHPQFAVKQLTLYLNGQGVPKESIEQHWPTVTLLHGLQPGRNTVEVVASSDSGKTMTRQLVVMVGGVADSRDASAALVQCAGSIEAITDEPPYREVVVETDIVEEPVYVEHYVYYDDTYYDDGPVYVYHRHPVVVFDPFVPIIPFFAFSVFYSNYHPYCPPPRWDHHRYEQPAVVNNYYGDGHHDGHGWHDGWHGGRPDHSSNNVAGADAHFHGVWPRGDGWRNRDPGSHADHHATSGESPRESARRDLPGAPSWFHRQTPSAQTYSAEGPGSGWSGRQHQAERAPAQAFFHRDASQMPAQSRAPIAPAAPRAAGRSEGMRAMPFFHNAERQQREHH